MGWLTDILRDISIFIDSIVYGFVYTLYNLFMSLANLKLFTAEAFEVLAERVYVVLGLFMLFRIGFSLLQYIAMPEKTKDETTGAGKMVSHTVLALFMLVITPWLFSQLYSLQGSIIKSNVIGKLILGASTTSGTGVDDATNLTLNRAATDTQFLLFGAFFQVDAGTIAECRKSPLLGSTAMALNDEKCLEKVAEAIKSNNIVDVNIESFYYINKAAGDPRHFNNFMKIVNVKVDDKYVFDYKSVISTIAGIIVIIMLARFCIDLALRAVYLGFLQLIAPVPIIAYIDPAKGSQIFTNWIREVVQTFLSLFFRLIAIFLAVFFIQIVAENILGSLELQYHDKDFCNDGSCDGQAPLLYVLLVIGTYWFAQKIPEYIEKIFNIPKVGESIKKGINGGLGFLTGGMTGLGVGSVTSYRSAREQGDGRLMSIGKGIVGGHEAALRGSLNGRKFNGNNPLGLVRSGITAGSQQSRLLQSKLLSGKRGVIERVDNAQKANDMFDDIDNAMISKINSYGTNSTYLQSKGFTGNEIDNIRNYNVMKQQYDAARERGREQSLHFSASDLEQAKQNAMNTYYHKIQNDQSFMESDNDNIDIKKKVKDLEDFYSDHNGEFEFAAGFNSSTYTQVKNSNEGVKHYKEATMGTKQYRRAKERQANATTETT